MKPVVASTVASTAYLLISHGSRDPRPQEAMNQLAELVRERLDRAVRADNCENSQVGSLSHESGERTLLNTKRLQNNVEHSTDKAAQAMTSNTASVSRVTSVLSRPLSQQQRTQPPSQGPVLTTHSSVGSSVIVETACLELSVLPLREKIYEFGRQLIADGITELKLLPIFLMAGVHVMEDIPAEIAAARQQLGKDIKLTVCEHLGSHPDISAVLKKRLTSVPAESSLLVAHGSRRPKGNKGIEQLAKLLNTQVAYWAVPPDIESQVIELMQQGCQRLTILPYFLFAGGITDAIAHRTEELAERFPKVQFRLLPTLGATDEIAKLSVEMIQAA